MMNAYFTDDVVLVQATGRDQYGKAKTETTTTVKGRFEWRTKVIRNRAGEEVTSAARVYLPSTATLTHEDKIRVGGVDRLILDIQEARDFSLSHYEVYIA